MRARFFAVFGMACQGMVPLGALMYGLLLDQFPYYYILLVITILTTAIAVLFTKLSVDEVYNPKSILQTQ